MNTQDGSGLWGYHDNKYQKTDIKKSRRKKHSSEKNYTKFL